jgi:hypothetical protein
MNPAITPPRPGGAAVSTAENGPGKPERGH